MKYPLYRHDRSRIALPSGRSIDDLSLAHLQEDRLGTADLGITEQTLRRQAQVAEAAGFPALARNLERAAELTRLPDAKILEIYAALRRGGPGEVLDALAREVENAYGATVLAAFLREAAALQA